MSERSNEKTEDKIEAKTTYQAWEQVSSYEEAQQYLLEIPRFTSKHSLEETRCFLGILGSPEDNKRIIHVAGTNGKGSVCAYLCSVLTQAGYKVGMFTSPHLVEMRERFRIGKELISKEQFLWSFQYVMGHLEQMRQVSQDTQYHPTFFELLFLMGLVLFREEKTDYIVLETGLGGRLDATNAIAKPMLTVITEIGYDHMEYLGDTIEKIAGEKAGIIKPAVPVVFCDKRKEATQVILETAQRLGSKAIAVGEEDWIHRNLTNKSIDFSMQSRYYDYIRLRLMTSALYQAENAAIAVRCIEELMEAEKLLPEVEVSPNRGENTSGRTAITLRQIQEGLAHARWEGRMEEVLPGVFVDGAHNEDGIRAFVQTVEADGCLGRRSVLFSAVADKDYELMIDILKDKPLFCTRAVVGIHSSRAAQPERLQQVFGTCAFYDDTKEALDDLLNKKKEDDLLYIVGSLYLVGEVKALLRRRTDD